MWDLVLPTEASEFERAEYASAQTIPAPCVLSVRTTSGMQQCFAKPDGRYGFVNPDIVIKNRRKQADRFRQIAEELAPVSGIQTTKKNQSRRTGT